MTSTDIVKIITACGTTGVKFFKLDGLEIDFESAADEPIAAPDLLEYDREETLEEVEDFEDDTDESLFTDPDEWDRIAREEAE